MASPKRYTDPEFGAKVAPEIYGGAFRHDKALAAGYAGKMQSEGGRGYYYQAMAVYSFCSIPWLRKLRQPTLVLAGNDDPLIPLVNMRVLADRIPNSELHVIDDGHLFLVTQAKTVAPIITQFLSGAAKVSKHPATQSHAEAQEAAELADHYERIISIL